MPLVGLGTWKIEKPVCADVVYTAIKVGYRLIDCASDYGNEKEVGEGINRAITEGLVTVGVLYQWLNWYRGMSCSSPASSGIRITQNNMYDRHF
jgi:diketogulonate reductase-like aldo/keto reductase